MFFILSWWSGRKMKWLPRHVPPPLGSSNMSTMSWGCRDHRLEDSPAFAGLSHQEKRDCCDCWKYPCNFLGHITDCGSYGRRQRALNLVTRSEFNVVLWGVRGCLWLMFQVQGDAINPNRSAGKRTARWIWLEKVHQGFKTTKHLHIHIYIYTHTYIWLTVDIVPRVTNSFVADDVHLQLEGNTLLNPPWLSEPEGNSQNDRQVATDFSRVLRVIFFLISSCEPLVNGLLWVKTSLRLGSGYILVCELSKFACDFTSSLSDGDQISWDWWPQRTSKHILTSLKSWLVRAELSPNVLFFFASELKCRSELPI